MLNCVSNLAWKKKEEKKALKILKKNKIKFLEFAPNLLLNNRFNIKEIKLVENKMIGPQYDKYRLMILVE